MQYDDYGSPVVQQTTLCVVGKVPYASARSAHRHAARKGGRRMRAYRCEECGRWHLTCELATRDGTVGRGDIGYHRERLGGLVMEE